MTCYKSKLIKKKNDEKNLFYDKSHSNNEGGKFPDLTIKEMFKLSLKGKSLKIMIDGHANAVKKLEKYFNKNPDRFLYNEMDPNHLFNHKLSNKKRLLYIACQEGNLEVKM